MPDHDPAYISPLTAGGPDTFPRLALPLVTRFRKTCRDCAETRGG